MGEVSEWLEEAVKKAEQRRKEPRGFRVVVRVSPSKVDEVSTELRRMGIKIIGTVSNFIFVDVDTMADVERISKIDGVVYVSKEKFFVPMAFGLDELFQRIGIMRDPILKHLTMGDLTELGFKFKPAAEIPNPIKALIENVNVLRTLMANPTKITQYLKWEFPFGLPVLARADWRLVTFTRELLGVPRDNRLSTKTYTAVIDSGVRYGPGLGSPAEIKTISFTLYPEPPVDCMSHGCLRNVKVYTSYCGLIDLENLWNSLDTEPILVKDGEYKPFNGQVLALDLNGVTRAEGVFRVKSDKKVIIETPMGTIESTPWHEFYVANPKYSADSKYKRKSWSSGYKIFRKRADELKARKLRNRGDWLVFKAYNGESWSLGADPKLAYLGGLVVGDGTIIYNNVNMKNGHVYQRKRGTRNEITINDKEKEFLEKLAKVYGGVVKKHNTYKGYLLRISKKKIIESVIPYLKPPINDLEAFRAWIAGFFDAEGYVEFRNDRPSDRVKICNTDKKLLEYLRDTLNTLGVPCSVWSGGESKGSRTWHLAPLIPQLFYRFIEPYCIKRKYLKEASRSENTSTPSRKAKFDGKYIFVPIKKIKIIESDEYFYDLANTTNKNYSANGFIVSNSWCHACSFGKPAMTRYGSFYPVANAPRSLHVKVFTGFGGCTSYQVMKAMEIAATEYGAKVVSISLGGLLTENIENDPECKLLDQLTEQYGTVWVIAAGNEGPGKWQVASPGAALKALTVAAHEANSEYTTSSYSSRGWSGKFYEKHPDIFEEHYAKWGDEFLKPDCCAPGGDKIQIVSAASLWYDGLMDFIPDGWDLMRGTSMSTPHIAGLVALAIDRGLLPQNVDKIKDILRKNPEKWIFGGEVMDSKSIEQGWGVFHWDRLKEIRGG